MNIENLTESGLREVLQKPVLVKQDGRFRSLSPRRPGNGSAVEYPAQRIEQTVIVIRSESDAERICHVYADVLGVDPGSVALE